MRAVFKLLQEIRNAVCHDELSATLGQMCELIKFDFFLLALSTPHSITQVETLVLDSFPVTWRRHYNVVGLGHFEAIVQYSQKEYLPVIWDDLLHHKKCQRSYRGIMNNIKNHGIKNGFSIPIHGIQGKFGIISFATSSICKSPTPLYTDAIPLVQLIIPSLQDALQRINLGHSEVKPHKLTKRERECLTWAAEGKSAWEISKIISCSERTVIFHLSNSISKLDATNRYQAISKALITGVIGPDLTLSP